MCIVCINFLRYNAGNTSFLKFCKLLIIEIGLIEGDDGAIGQFFDAFVNLLVVEGRSAVFYKTGHTG